MEQKEVPAPISKAAASRRGNSPFKAGLNVPLRAWLRSNGAETVEEITSSATFKARGLFDVAQVNQLVRLFVQEKSDCAYTLFSIVAVELWCRQLGEAALARTS